MNRLIFVCCIGAALVPVTYADAQVYTAYYAPVVAYYQPTTVYNAPTLGYASVPTTVYYGSPPATTYVASRPTTVYYGSSTTTVYYGTAPAVTTVYRPLVGRGITRVGYAPAVIAQPVATPVTVFHPCW